MAQQARAGVLGVQLVQSPIDRGELHRGIRIGSMGTFDRISTTLV